MKNNPELPQIIQENISPTAVVSQVDELVWRIDSNSEPQSYEGKTLSAKAEKKPRPSGRGASLIVSGPSGVGKDTVVNLLDWAKFTRVRTATTRQRREGEGEDDYYWLSREEFEDLEGRGEFIETNQYAENWYGTWRVKVEEVMGGGKIPVFRIDPRGARHLKELQQEGERLFQGTRLVYFFVVTESEEELRERLVGRGLRGAVDENLEKRLDIMKEDLSLMKYADFVVMNEFGKEAEAAAEIEKQVLDLAQER